MSSLNTKLDRIATEPFRLFFPLGILASAIGVLLWPTYFAGWITTYPLAAHARWMVIGFAGCFITGFIGTAGPRLLGTDPWFRFEIILHTIMALVVFVLLSLNRIAAADLFTGFWLLGVLKSMIFRLLVGRQDVPPPGLPLVFLGITGAMLAGFALSMESFLTFSMPVRNFWRLLYFQGFLWLPILGVAPYLLPRFFGRKSPHSFPDSTTLPAGWTRPFIESLIVGLLLIASFALEAWRPGPSGIILRTVVVVVYLSLSVPGLVSWSKVNGLGLALRWILPCAAGGWLLAVAFPPLRIGMLHLMFIGSAGLLMLAVATRVILGHNERRDRLAAPMKWFHWVWAMVLITAATRLTSDFIFKVRVTHFIYAAILWVIVLAFWSWKLRRELKQPVFEEGIIKTKCPRRKRQQAARMLREG
ncbi:NnrS family protein [Haloferula sp.]|uniref:NnrS family protein n=1 Tax=Haloferula sp. TaxID=2497595 RepID=UPI003C7893E2